MKSVGILISISLILVCGLLGAETRNPVKKSQKPERTIKIISRSAWGAKPPQGKLIPQTPKMIVIHHSATEFKPADNPAAQVKSDQAYHMGKENRWPDIAYHYLIDHNGNIYKGRDDNAQGDSRTKYDL